MNRVAFFIDGFNLYHSLNGSSVLRKYKWLNLCKLAHCLITSHDQIAKILYFTTYTPWDKDKLQRHQVYVRALQSVGVEIVLGAFRRVDKKCRACFKTYTTYEEKQTDVNIAIQLFETAVKDFWDTGIVISGDSDLIPAIRAVKSTFLSKRIGIVIPIGRRAEELKQSADYHMKLKERHLRSSQFDDTLLVDGVEIRRPIGWK